jgi:UDP-N-acetylglucosamine 1-carboxyvinyltransferase
MLDTRYRIEGISPLRGEISLGGAKNAALPCMCAALLTDEEVVLKNVPAISDVYSLLDIFTFLGVEHEFEGNTLKIRAENLECKTIPHDLVKKLRASILLLGPLLARCGEVKMAYPGGCVIGKRPVYAHIDSLVQLGAEDISNDEVLHLKGDIKNGEVILPEFSVTATENILMAAAHGNHEVHIKLAASEPHVQDLCNLLVGMGANIKGIGSHDLIIKGSKLSGAEHSVTTDYLEAGFFALAGILTGGDLRIKGFREEQMVSFLKTLTSLGAMWDLEDSVLHVKGGKSLKACNVKTNVFPGFPTDLQAAIGVAMTQASGVSRVFERMFEGRLGYLFELEKMGAHVEILNAHQALIIGPTQLRGRTVTSNDIRAGAGMVLAGLCARGETLITDVQYIERGYEKLEEKLRSVGARIERIEDGQVDSAHDYNKVERQKDSSM